MSTNNGKDTVEKREIAQVMDLVSSPEDAKRLMKSGYQIITPNSKTLSVQTYLDKGFDQEYIDGQLAKRYTIREAAARAKERQDSIARRNADAQDRRNAIQVAIAQVPPVDTKPAAAAAPVFVDPARVGRTEPGMFSMNNVQYKITNDVLRVFNDDGHKHPDSPAYVTNHGNVVVELTIVHGARTYPYTLTKNSVMYANLKNYIRANYPYVAPPVPFESPARAPQVQTVDSSDESSIEPIRSSGYNVLSEKRQHELERRCERRLKGRKQPSGKIGSNANTICERIVEYMEEPGNRKLTLFDAFRKFMYNKLSPCRYHDRAEVWHEASIKLQQNVGEYFSPRQIESLAFMCTGLAVADSRGMFTSAKGYALA